MQQLARRQLLKLFGGSLALAACAPSPLWSQQDADDGAAEFLQPATREAIQRGLSYLAARQTEDGAMGRGGYSRNVAVISLSGLAFLAAGHTPGRGRFGNELNRCVQFVLDHASPSGFITSPRGSSSHGPMYGHGFATLFLAEVYGMTSDSQIRETLAKAVKQIIHSQNVDGGWRYQPKADDADISVTICQVMALRAARNAGIYVPNETVDRCIDYVKRCQNPDGGFMYMLSQPGNSRFPRSAAGVVALYSAGVYEGEELRKGLDYLMERLPRGNAPSREPHFFYGHYYGVQAMWHAGGNRWRQWYPAIRDALLARQNREGSWSDAICSEYATAMACIILQMPNNYLPIFQR